MKKIILITTVLFITGLNMTYAQQAFLTNRTEKPKSTLQVQLLKETGSANAAEEELIKIRNYEQAHGVKVVSDVQWEAEQKTAGALERKIFEGKEADVEHLRSKLSYIQNHIVRYGDIKNKLNQ